MGWNDHVDFALLDDCDELVERGLLDADSPLCALVEKLAYGHVLTPRESAVCKRELLPLFDALEEARGEEHMHYLLGKD